MYIRQKALPESKSNHLLLLIASYLFLLALHGYSYGHGDTIEVYPYAKWMMDGTLYPSDFYIQNTIQLVPNERYLLAVFFSWTGKWMPWVALLFHFLTCTFLLEGLYRIGKKFIMSEGLLWLAILTPVSLLYGINLGGNEMYIPFFTSGTFSISVCVWAILFFLEQDHSNSNYWKTYGLLIIAGFIQPIVSIQLFVILSGVLVLEQMLDFSKDGFKLWTPIICCVAYLLTTGVWIYYLNSNFSSGSLSNAALFEFFEFRLPHHYKPSYYPIKHYLFLIPVILIGAFYYMKHNRRLFLFFVLALLGMIVFTIGVEGIEHSSILAAQWFKTSLWLKAFALIGITSLVESNLSILRDNRINKAAVMGVMIAGIWAILVFINPGSIFSKRYLDFPFYEVSDAKTTISRIAKANTSNDAIFLVPMTNTHFKFHSERSTYVDFKAVIHRGSVIPTWYERVQELYGINIDDRKKGVNLYQKGTEFYKNLSPEDLSQFSRKGVSHILTFKGINLPFEVVGENEEYIIYQLK